VQTVCRVTGWAGAAAWVSEGGGHAGGGEEAEGEGWVAVQVVEEANAEKDTPRTLLPHAPC